MTTPDYDAIRTKLLEGFKDHAPEDEKGLAKAEDRLVRSFVHFDDSAITMEYRKPFSRDEVINSLCDKDGKPRNITVLCGGGKDSEFVLAVARTLQLMVLHDYGKTFELRVGVGRQPGMIDAFDNLKNCFKNLKFKGDPLVDAFYIDRHTTHPFYGKRDRAALAVLREANQLSRDDVLMNGHIFGGAGRRTFCDDCNNMLAGWIATALACKGGADLFMTGDSRQELLAQIKRGVPRLAQDLGVTLAEPSGTPTQNAFHILQNVGDEHSLNVHGPDGVKARSVPAEAVPEKTRLFSISPDIHYDSENRLPFLQNILGFDINSLAFSFTETDCGNPALMAHLYGLKEKLAGGGTYADGVMLYAHRHAIPIMRQKHFSETMIAMMEERYKDAAATEAMGKTVEDYARRTYGLTPDNLEAMVYSPFTQNGTNLHRYLEYLNSEKKHYPRSAALLGAEPKIRALAEGRLSNRSHPQLIRDLHKATGLSLHQIQALYATGLQVNPFDKNHVPSDGGRFGRALRENDTLYTSRVTGPDGQERVFEGR